MLTILAVALALGAATGALFGTLWYYRLTDPHGVYARMRHLRQEVEVLHRAVAILEARLRTPGASLRAGEKPRAPRQVPRPSDTATAPVAPLRGNTLPSSEGAPPRTGPVGRMRVREPMLRDPEWHERAPAGGWPRRG